MANSGSQLRRVEKLEQLENLKHEELNIFIHDFCFPIADELTVITRGDVEVTRLRGESEEAFRARAIKLIRGNDRGTVVVMVH